MKKIDRIVLKYPDEEFLKADGFDSAIIGVTFQMNKPPKLVYSIKKCIQILEKEMTHADAEEYFYFNVAFAYVGEKTPIWVEDEL